LERGVQISEQDSTCYILTTDEKNYATIRMEEDNFGRLLLGLNKAFSVFIKMPSLIPSVQSSTRERGMGTTTKVELE